MNLRLNIIEEKNCTSLLIIYNFQLAHKVLSQLF